MSAMLAVTGIAATRTTRAVDFNIMPDVMQVIESD